jgi:uncharacterized damage-inducible protein DinB
MEQVKWFDRNFNFNIEQNIFPSIIERLAGTPARLEEKFRTIPPVFLNLRFNNTWSIKENVGHLIDLEPLWQGRLEDIISGKTELQAADLQNRKTYLANHNDKSLDELLYSFRQIRGETLSAIEKIDESIVFKSALHPRLKTPMRTMDLFLFVAEHDDHHLARITELAKIFLEKPFN